jgi:hypothetical protein
MIDQENGFMESSKTYGIGAALSCGFSSGAVLVLLIARSRIFIEASSGVRMSISSEHL